MADNKTATPSPEELLQQREDALAAREKAVEKKETDLAAKVAKFESDSQEHQKREELYRANEKELKELKAEIKSLNKKLAKSEAAPAKVVPGLDFEFEGLKYKFKDNAPKSIRIEGVVKSQKELAADEENLLQLVASNSGLIEKIYE